MVVDDDVDICMNVRDILVDLGYRVDVAHCGEDALQFVAKQKYDVALLDFKMQGMDGVSLFREIKAIQADVVGILVTAYVGHESVNEAVDAGTWHILRKPVDFGQLINLIQQATARPCLLLVDDDREFCDNLWQILREQQYRVCLAYSAQEAKDFLDQGDYQLALVDFRLGAEDGGEVLRAIDELKLDLPVIMLTGYSDELQRRLRVANVNFEPAIHTKPLDVAKLLKDISQVL